MPESPLPGDKKSMVQSGGSVLVEARGRSTQVVFASEADLTNKVGDAAGKDLTTVSEMLKACASAGLMKEGEGIALQVGDQFFYPGQPLSAQMIGRHGRASVVFAGRAPQTSELHSNYTGSLLVVSGGPGSGSTYALTAGEHIIGRGAGCDIVLPSASVSAKHARISVSQTGVSITDLGGKNGTFAGPIQIETANFPVPIGSVLNLGACRITITTQQTPSSSLGPIAEDGRQPFYRSAQVTAGPTPGEVSVPQVPSGADRPPKFNWVTTVVPLLAGIGLTLYFKNPAMAIFSILGPVMSVTNFFQEKHKYGKRVREVAEAVGQAQLTLALDVALQRNLEVQAREFSCPDPGLVLARCLGPSPELWQRRVSRSNDALRVHIGRSSQPWRPSIRGGGEPEAAGRPLELVNVLQETVLTEVPVGITLGYGASLGIVGSKDAARSMARSLVCQLASLVGPGELKIVTVADLASAEDFADWSWVGLLPHSQQSESSNGAPAMAGSSAEVELLFEETERAIRSAQEISKSIRGFDGGSKLPSMVYVVVVEMGVLSDGSRTALQRFAALGSAGKIGVHVISLAPTSDLLPSFCSEILAITDASVGIGSLASMKRGASHGVITLATTPVSAAIQISKKLCGLRDPESADGVQSLPSTVSLLPLLALGVDGPAMIQAIEERWKGNGARIATSFRATLGVGEDGPMEVDFVTDGPHALVGGTTGSGKSELLRSLVASTAATYSPADVNFVLVDYKGGSAFDVCAGLPHVVGIVTDLDEQLGERALVSLEAELRRRELLLRSAGATDFPEFRHDPKNATIPLPRLMVIIDEFATMAKELPDFLAALVGIAQRGRSLGIHLLLATQRPSGVVSENIKANTNLRIALRVQDTNDSQDVIGSPAAASISRRIPGRAIARFGPGEQIRFQAARVVSQPLLNSIASLGAPSDSNSGDDLATAGDASPQGASETIEALVAAVGSVWKETGLAPPQRPWLDTLPTSLQLEDLGAVGTSEGESAMTETRIALGLLDEPSRQQQRLLGWQPSQGNVAIVGLPGSGATGLLTAFAYQLAASFSPNDCHLYALDFGEGIFGPLLALPHTGAVIVPVERDRLARLLRTLRAEVDSRRALTPDDPQPPVLVVLIDNLSGLLAAIDEIALGARDDFARIVADGPALRCCFVLSADRPGAFPISLSAGLVTKFVFRLADPSDVVQFGVERRLSPPAIVGRALALPEKLFVQTLNVSVQSFSDLARRYEDQTVESASRFNHAPFKIQSLPVVVDMEVLSGSARTNDEVWFLPVGLGDESLAAEGFHMRAGEHVLITSPAHAGKSTALSVMGHVARAAGATVSILALRRSPVTLYGPFALVCDRFESIPEFVQSVRALSVNGPHLLLIDDAEGFDDPEGVLVKLLIERIDNLRIVVAARGDILRSKFGHWTVEVRRSRIGLVLRPVVDLDGDLWFTTLPRKGPVRFRDGLGYVIANGVPQLVQVGRLT
jgi:DNA segregation ATPase FtsK/SpoIIIE, S-DNA-T family